MRFVVSTVGTSILTNLIDKTNPTETTWHDILRDSANLTKDELDNEVQEVIEQLGVRALEELSNNDVAINRKISAELNGIYGIYGGSLPKNSNDQHYLICTDTEQGQQTGELIRTFLEEYFCNVEVVTPRQLSTKDTESFTTGTKELIQWLEDNMAWQRDSGYDVIFNLVGGFKSLFDYMSSFGAFYADEVVYIFEAPTADLIRKPRLPIDIDTTPIEKHRDKFASMAGGKSCQRGELDGIPETLLNFLDEDDDNSDTDLSTWGLLLWNRTKANFLKRDISVIQDLDKRIQAKLALMDAGKEYPKAEAEDIPAVLLEFVKVGSETCAKLSVWGKLVWDQTKEDLLAKELLPFPRLQYNNSFKDDFDDQKRNSDEQRYKLQETLAKVACLLDGACGNTAVLRGGGLGYDPYKGKHRDIAHFYVTHERRVSCKASRGNLILRHCGEHDYVNDNP